MQVELEAEARCMVVGRGANDDPPIRLCLQAPGYLGHELTLDHGNTSLIYGLGEQFNDPGATHGDYMGKWRGGGVLGNDMVTYLGGIVGNAHFPIMHALEPKKKAPMGSFRTKPGV